MVDMCLKNIVCIVIIKTCVSDNVSVIGIVLELNTLCLCRQDITLRKNIRDKHPNRLRTGKWKLLPQVFVFFWAVHVWCHSKCKLLLCKMLVRCKQMERQTCRVVQNYCSIVLHGVTYSLFSFC